METQLIIDGRNHKLTNSNSATICYVSLNELKTMGLTMFTNVFSDIKIQDNILVLMGFYTQLEHRKKGYALQFLQLLINHYTSTNLKGFILGVDKNNIAAINLYHKVGFKIHNTTEKYHIMLLNL